MDRDKIKVGVVSLGCDKNRVDTENMLYYIKQHGFQITASAEDADVIIINTCAFIDDSKREAIDTVLEFTELKSQRNIKVIVTGCLPERYKTELVEGFPDVDAFLGIGDYMKIGSVIDNVLSGKREVCFDCNDLPTTNRILSTPYHYAYLKIADGCDNHCTYCAIPKIRGKYRSRTVEGLVDEARELYNEYGIKELILVAQDITRYGIDIYNEYSLLKLLDKLSELDITWIRLMYCYPELMTDEVINYVAKNDKICNYLDIPLQHINDKILKMMNRNTDSEKIKRLIDKIRTANDKIAIRSSFIVGFPDETDAEFKELCDFISEYRLDYAGFFTYSKEEGTPAYKLKNQIPSKIKNERKKIITDVQTKIISENNKKYLNNTVKVLYEGIDYDKNKFYGRPEFCAPDIDSKVLFTSKNLVEIGNFYDVTVTECDGYDLIGEVK